MKLLILVAFFVSVAGIRATPVRLDTLAQLRARTSDLEAQISQSPIAFFIHTYVVPAIEISSAENSELARRQYYFSLMASERRFQKILHIAEGIEIGGPDTTRKATNSPVEAAPESLARLVAWFAAVRTEKISADDGTEAVLPVWQQLRADVELELGKLERHDAIYGGFLHRLFVATTEAPQLLRHKAIKPRYPDQPQSRRGSSAEGEYEQYVWKTQHWDKFDAAFVRFYREEKMISGGAPILTWRDLAVRIAGDRLRDIENIALAMQVGFDKSPFSGPTFFELGQASEPGLILQRRWDPEAARLGETFEKAGRAVYVGKSKQLRLKPIFRELFDAKMKDPKMTDDFLRERLLVR